MASSAKGKEQLIAQMTSIVESLTENNKKLQERLAREKESRDKMKETELALIEKEREYVQPVFCIAMAVSALQSPVLL